MAKITNNPVITLTHDETRDAIVEGLRKKFGKKMFPADLKNETVKIDYQTPSTYKESGEPDYEEDVEVSSVVVTLPSIESTVAAPEAPAAEA